MKKGFISVITLLVLLIISLSITFIYNQQRNNLEYANDIYNKKKAIYLADSILNSYIEDNSQYVSDIILKDYDNNKIDKTKSRFIINNSKYIYDGKVYYINISHTRNSKIRDLDDLYMIFINNVTVGGSQANAEKYIKVYDKLEEDNTVLDKNRLKIIISHAF